MKLTVNRANSGQRGDRIEIQGDRTELIKLATELLKLAALDEPDFDQAATCSPCHFLFDEVGYGFAEFLFTRESRDPGIGELGLSVRSRKTLQRMNITTLGKLAQTTEAELRNSKNFGEHTFENIVGVLSEHGLTLKHASDAVGDADKQCSYCGGSSGHIDGCGSGRMEGEL